MHVDVDWMPKGFEAIRIGKPEYGEFFIFNGNIYQYSESPFKDLLTGEILNTCPPLPLIIVSKIQDKYNAFVIHNELHVHVEQKTLNSLGLVNGQKINSMQLYEVINNNVK
ncbi:MAG: hypothetical protein WC107_04795 [Patescibacteria group bacterium]